MTPVGHLTTNARDTSSPERRLAGELRAVLQSGWSRSWARFKGWSANGSARSGSNRWWAPVPWASSTEGSTRKTAATAAVKVVSDEFAQGGKIRDRFEREAEILQQFRHPNIVRFLAVGRFRGTSYIAMEYVQGETVEKMILDRGGIASREVVDLAIQVCDALHYAHEHGVVHRDLKPSNLMLTTDGKIKLTDFGIAKDLDATALTATGRTLGTAAYMSPEQIRGTPAVSHKTDLYALGVVLYQMLVGKPPFEGTTPVVLMHCHLNEPASEAQCQGGARFPRHWTI